MTFDVDEVEADPIIKQWTYDGMGGESQGDGSIQFPAPDKDGIVKPVILILPTTNLYC